MRDFLLAPFLSLFSLNFYRRLLHGTQSIGFLYLVYLSFLVSLAGLLLLHLQFFPVAAEFAGWLEKNAPQIVFTQEGAKMSIEEPLLLIHPRWGALFYLDPTNDFPSSADLEKAMVIVTRTQIAYRDPSNGETRIQDLVPKAASPQWQDFVLNRERLRELWNRLLPFLNLIIFISLFFGLYLWKLMTALIYSLIGLVINRFRIEHLPYRFILNLAFYALTPMMLVQLLKWSFPTWPIPVNFFTSIIVTCLYLSLAVLGTQSSSSTKANDIIISR